MRLNLLLVCCFEPQGLLAIKQNISNLVDYSEHEIVVCNLYPDVSKKKNVNLNDFDGLIIHNTACYKIEMISLVENALNTKLEHYNGIKIIFKQDEHLGAHVTARILGQKKFDLLFTCVPKDEHPKVYPRELIGGIELVNYLTGYVSDDLIEYCSRKNYIRNIDISYRGSFQPLQCGVLGFEKWFIGESVKSYFEVLPYKCDISSDWEKRIHGIDWINFLLSSKISLGVESGSNLFDFDNNLSQVLDKFESKHKKYKNEPYKLYQAAQKILEPFEGNVKYAQVSPRHFEAAVTKTLQVLYEGEYSGIFRPYEHYVPLKRDLSNINEVEEYILNARKREIIIERAYEEIALNPKYNIKSFVKIFDEKISKSRKRPTKSQKQKIKRGNIIILAPHALHADPRIKWLETSLAEDFDVFAIGGITSSDLKRYFTNDEKPNHLHVNISLFNLNTDDFPMDSFREEYYILHELLLSYSTKKYSNVPSRLVEDSAALDRHKSACSYYLKMSYALQEAVRCTVSHNGTLPSAIVCCDLPALLPAAVISRKFDIPLVYDSHELWCHADVNFSSWEVDFWINYERRLLAYVHLPVTVSKNLANILNGLYGLNFLTVANAELKKNYLYLPNKKNILKTSKLIFLFQGGFAVGRGIEKLIRIWKHVRSDCHLILRGPNNPFKEEMIKLAEHLALFNKTVFFDEPVHEDQLVFKAMEADIGIIPYDPGTSPIYRYCCPNKLSQYMAASLPIITNQLPEVNAIITKAECGFCVDFDESEQLIDVINRLADSESLREKLGSNARAYFLSEFNWEKVASPINIRLSELIPNGRISEVLEIPKTEDILTLPAQVLLNPEIKLNVHMRKLVPFVPKFIRPFVKRVYFKCSNRRSL